MSEINHENLEKIKEQLLKQIDKFPEDQRATIAESLKAMSDEEFVEFIKENGLLSQEGKEQKCIFCSIAKGEISSFKVGENKTNIAILEINPASKAHTIIIPKEHISEEKLGEESVKLAKEVSEKIKAIFNPKEISVSKKSIMGHGFLDILPIYEGQSKEDKRSKASEEELQKIQVKFTEYKEKLKEKEAEKAREEKSEKKEEKKLPKVKRRMP